LGHCDQGCDWGLPTSNHGEKNGSFINVDGSRQRFGEAFPPHGQSLPEWAWIAKFSKRLRVRWPHADEAALARAAAEHLAAAPATTPAADEAAAAETPAEA